MIRKKRTAKQKCEIFDSLVNHDDGYVAMLFGFLVETLEGTAKARRIVSMRKYLDDAISEGIADSRRPTPFGDGRPYTVMIEFERFLTSDDYLDIRYRGKPASKTKQCEAVGNSMAVPVMRWIGERISKIESEEP